MSLSQPLRFLVLCFLLALVPGCRQEVPGDGSTHELVLTEGWRLRASQGVSDGGEVVSLENLPLDGWYNTRVPRTVLAALVDNGVYKDPYFGRNLEKIPAEQFRQSWWYRTEFSLSDRGSDQHAELVFEGINYSANIWLNGHQIAGRDAIRGAFRIFRHDVTGLVKPAQNVLAVEVFPPEPGDFTIGFVDWNPTAPDRNMGLWREVKLRLSGPVSLQNPFVQTRLGADHREASLSLTTDLVNWSDQPAKGVLTGELAGRSFRHDFLLDPHETRKLSLDAEQVPELRMQDPKLWWPNNLGEPFLYNMKLSVTVNGTISDRRQVDFGVREVADFINEDGHRGYLINGKKVLIRGAGWVDDLMLADDASKIEAQMKYARHMNLNTIRLEGFWGSSQTLYDLADKYGLLIMVGWSCQWEWENYLGKPADDFGGIKTPEDIALISESLRDQVLWLRNHPSILVWVFGSDMLPRPALERAYNATLAEIDPTRPLLAACSLRVSEISGPTAVKMNGPYDYVTPNYWYEDTEHGGAFGFNTETGPGPQPPPIESIRKMIPEEHLWPIDDMWDFHCGRNEFNTMGRYLNALNNRYGEPANLEDFLNKAQLANYEAIRAMFEAFGVNKFKATGVIQWMLNSAWPETYWQLYDWYLMPNGAFYGTRVASAPLHLVYHYGDGDIYLVNDTLKDQTDLVAEIRVLDAESRQVFNKEVEAGIAPNSSRRLFDLPVLENLTPVYFVDLRLRQRGGAIVDRNFYWLSTSKDVLDSEKTLWFVTPNKAFADFRALEELPSAGIGLRAESREEGGERQITVSLVNESDKLAFFVELKIVGERSKELVLPVLWEDNYVSLLPQEERSIQVRFDSEQLKGETPVVRIQGVNVSPGEFVVGSAAASN